jgi:hypothetical protein
MPFSPPKSDWNQLIWLAQRIRVYHMQLNKIGRAIAASGGVLSWKSLNF